MKFYCISKNKKYIPVPYPSNMIPSILPNTNETISTLLISELNYLTLNIEDYNKIYELFH